MFNLKKILFLSILLSIGTLVQAQYDLLAFHKANFTGDYFSVQGAWSANHSRDHWNDAINSVIVPQGYEAYLYEYSDFRGEYIVVSGEWSSRQHRYWYNRISSIRLVRIRGGQDDWHQGNHQNYDDYRQVHTCDVSCRRACSHAAPEIIVFEDGDFRGRSLRIRGNWSVEYTNDYWNDRVSSIIVPRGYAIILYEHSHFQGRSAVIEDNWSTCQARDFWNDRVSSIRVVPK